MDKPKGGRRKGSSKVHPIIKGLLLAVVASYLIWLTFNYAVEVVKASMVEVELARYGSIQDTVTFEGVLVREETVLSSPSGGKLEAVAMEGERVRVGGLVAKVGIPDVNSKDGIKVTGIKAPVSGVVSYHLDGLENTFNPDNIEKVDFIDTWAKNPGKSREVGNGSQVKGGEPLAKLVNNLTPMFLVGAIDKNQYSLEKLKESKHLMVLLSEEEHPVFLDVFDASTTNNKIKLVLEINNYSAPFITERQHELTIIKQRYEGYIVPTQAIVEKEDKPGLYTIYKNSIRWQPVKVLGQIDQQSAVSGLSPDTSYIENPEYVKEGQYIR